jgi:diguanylate cyclase (GGDEF)-like protein
VDILTGLYRSDYVIYKAINSLNRAVKYPSLSLILITLDILTKSFGHAVGDNILKEIAQILKSFGTAGTFLCRYGGDEFALVTDKCAEACEAMVQDILSRIRQYDFCEGISISVSAGIAGGRRRNPRKGNMYRTIINLINLASLASTKAKKEKDNLVLGYSGMIDEIAI